MTRTYKVAFDMVVDNPPDNTDMRLMRSLLFDRLDEELFEAFDDIDRIEGLTVTEAGDPVNPAHYKSTMPIECIEITEQLSFCQGNAVKYIWRAGEKPGADWRADVAKARWYADRETARQQNGNVGFSDEWQPVYGVLAKIDEAKLDEVQRAKLRCVRELVARKWPLSAIDEFYDEMEEILG